MLKKQIIAIVLAIIMCVGTYSFALAAEPATNTKGEDYSAVSKTDSTQEAFAVYSDSDGSLVFYADDAVPQEGGTYAGKDITAVYTGFDDAVYTKYTSVPWYPARADITYVSFDDSFKDICPRSTAYWFYSFTNCTSIDLNNLNTSSTTNMSYMFYKCSAVTSLDLSMLDTGNVTTMREMFNNCTSLKSLNLNGIDTGNVTDMYDMFISCSALKSLDVSGLDTGNVTTMYGMFYKCSALASLDISGFDTGNVTTMAYMFYNCSSLSSINLNGLDTASVTHTFYMFCNCSSLTSLDLTGFNTEKVNNMEAMFYGCSSLTTLKLDDFNTSEVTSMYRMFCGCSSLKAIDLSGFDTGKVKDMSDMFNSCASLASLDVSGFNTEKVRYMDGMFNNCSALATVYSDDSIFVTTAVESGDGMFSGCTKINGSCGTSYNSSKTSYTMAHVDTKNNAGYFSCEHDYKSVITSNPTCTKNGAREYTCTKCGYSYSRVLNATGHTVVTDKAVAATCANTGLTEGSHCSACGQVIVKQDVIAKKAHDYSVSGNGPIKTYKCKNCGYTKTEYIDGLFKSSSGSWYYYTNGRIDTSYTGFAENGNGKWYIEKGHITFKVNGVFKDQAGTIGDAGTWYYVIANKVQTSFTGLANYSNENGWWYIKNGKVDFSHNGVDKNKNGWYYVTGGKVQFDFTGLANYKNKNGWWYINGGKVNFNHNGVDKNKNGWYYVTGGKVQFNFTGLANYKNENGWWYINGGKVNFNHNGVDKNKNGWYYVTGGKVQFKFTGLADYRNKSGWYYIKNGKVDFTHTGVDKNKNGWYYTKRGKVDFSYTGFVESGADEWYVEGGKASLKKNSVIKDTTGALGEKGAWYYVVGSRVRTSYTGVANHKNKYGWWYVKNGKVDFNHKGVDKNKNGWWYTSGGKVQFSHNGVDKNSKGWWVIRGGKVQFDYTGFAANENGVWAARNGKVYFNANWTQTINGITYAVNNGRVCVEGSNIVTGGGSNERALANSYVCTIPANIIYDYVEAGCTIRFVGTYTWPEWNDAAHSWAVGVQCGDKIELKSGEKDASLALPHEMGHYIDKKLKSGKYSNSASFKKTMWAEIGAYRDAFYADMDNQLLNDANVDTTEYFADAFKMYCLHRSELKSRCPSTYSFVEGAVKAL